MGDPNGASREIIVIRPATLADAGAIVEIYNREVTETTATFDLVARTLDEQQEWLAARSGAFAAIVGVDPTSKQVVAFASLSPYKERAAYRTTVEDSIYVHRDFGGRGIGKLMLERLVEVARRVGFPLGDGTNRGLQRGLTSAACVVRLRADRGRARSRPQVPPMARRSGDATPALIGRAATPAPS